MEFIADIGGKTALLMLLAFGLERMLKGMQPELRQMLWLGTIAGGLLAIPVAFSGFGFYHPIAFSNSLFDSYTMPGGFSLETVNMILFTFWLGIASLCLIRFLTRTANMKKHLTIGSYWLRDQYALAVAEECAHRIGFTRRIPVRVSPAAVVPAVIGVLDPEIVVPVSFADWDIQLQQSTLCHELAHIRRGDNVWSILTAIFEAFYWFLPFVRTIRQRIEREREFICDNSSVRACDIAGSEYANHLLNIAESAIDGGGRMLAADISFTASPLAERVERIFTASNSKSADAKIVVRAGFAAAATVCAITLAFSLQSSPKPISSGITPTFQTTSQIPILSR